LFFFYNYSDPLDRILQWLEETDAKAAMLLDAVAKQQGIVIEKM
jgi:hypothetical protein